MAPFSNSFNISLDSVQRQLEKFQNAGVLVSKSQGRTLLYTWNPKSRMASRLKEMVAVSYEAIPLSEREKVFVERRRSRAKDKPVVR
jgi:hypothetical protein